MGMTYDSDQIARILPHRYPFALVDRVVDGEPGRWARGIKCVTVNEPFFQGHFPQKHVMPGVLLIEAMAQVGGVAILALLGRVRDARFKRQVVPGDVVEMECVLTKRRGPIGVGTCRATVNGQEAATAELTFAIGAE